MSFVRRAMTAGSGWRMEKMLLKRLWRWRSKLVSARLCMEDEALLFLPDGRSELTKDYPDDHVVQAAEERAEMRREYRAEIEAREHKD